MKTNSTYFDYPYGMVMPGRSDADDNYRYGFNGKEMDDEVKEIKGSSYDFGARMYDPRVGRWMIIDKKAYKSPDLSPYIYVNNDPLRYIDPDGNFLIDVHRRIMRSAFRNSKLGDSRILSTVRLNSGQLKRMHIPNPAIPKDVKQYRLALVGGMTQIYGGSVISPDVKSLPKIIGGGGEESVDKEHFDNMGDFQQILANYNDVYKKVNDLTSSYSAGEISAKELGEKVGPYFHALQDLYSHSNYVELYAEMFGKTDASLIPTLGEVLNNPKYADFKVLLQQKLHTGSYCDDCKGEGSHKDMNHDLGKGSGFDGLEEVEDKNVNWNSKAAESVATKSSTYINDKIEEKIATKK